MTRALASRVFRLLIMPAAAGWMAESANAQGRPAPGTLRGIAGGMEIRAAGSPLRAKAHQTRLSPVLVRIAEARPLSDGDVCYQAEFIGLVAGHFDLRDFLERQDGGPLDLPPLPVSILSTLDAHHGTDLFSTTAMPGIARTYYRAVMWTLGALWLSVPVIYAVVRWTRRRPPRAPLPAAPPPSLAEQLRPLAEGALRGSLSLAERARLELLMYLYWRERLGLEGAQADVVRQLRLDERAGRLLRAVEAWLHSVSAPAPRPQADLAALLEPYRAAGAIAVIELDRSNPRPSADREGGR